MIARPTPIDGVFVIETEIRRDARGEFSRLFCADELAPLLGERRIMQVNRSSTRRTGSIRGLHYQRRPHAEMKLIRCLRGRVFDVAVDLRAESRSFMQWYGEDLSPSNAYMLVIPEGCAHGFQTLEPDCELLYLHTAAYAPDAEGGVAFGDPRLGIPWPLGAPPAGGVSERDAALPSLPPNFAGLPW